MPRTIQSLVEEQLGEWRLRSKTRRSVPPTEFVPANVITFSNAPGTNGVRIADMLGRRLELPVYGREIVEHIATTERLHVETVECLDEVVVGRVDDYVAAIFREKSFDQNAYLRGLTRTITALWGHGPCILVGRGSEHIVSRRHSLAVRTTAPLERRIAGYAKRNGLSLEEAEKRVKHLDAQRKRFVRRYFGHDIDDPAHYDLIVNTTGFGITQSAGIIAHAYMAKFGIRKR